MKFLPLLVLVLIFTAPPLQAAPEKDFPKRAVITMRGYWGFMPVGKAVQTWTLNDKNYHLENRMAGLGFSLRYVSEGTVENGELRPSRYAEYRGKDSQPKYESRFDWQNNKVTLGSPSDPRSETMQKPIQDLNALPFDLAWREGRPLVYEQLSNGRKLKRGPFVRGDEQTMTVGGKTLKVVYLLSRLPKQTVEVWLAPELNYLPLRIKYTGSEKIEMLALKVELDGKTVLGD